MSKVILLGMAGLWVGEMFWWQNPARASDVYLVGIQVVAVLLSNR